MSNLAYIDFEPDDLPDTAAQVPPIMPHTEDMGEFMQRRAGKITASRMADMLAGGKGITRTKYLRQLAIERLTGQPLRGGFKSAATEHGSASENEALELYAFQHDVDVTKCGFVPHPAIEGAGCSPDALVGADGMAQVKAPEQLTHLEYLESREVPRPYFLQMQWEMACAQRQWSDFVSYDPDQIPRLRLLVIRVHRDCSIIAGLEEEAITFNKEINALVKELKEL